jgi:hypothetical protein
MMIKSTGTVDPITCMMTKSTRTVDPITCMMIKSTGTADPITCMMRTSVSVIHLRCSLFFFEILRCSLGVPNELDRK